MNIGIGAGNIRYQQNLCWQAVHLVLLSMTTPVCHTLKLRCEINSKYICDDNEKY